MKFLALAATAAILGSALPAFAAPTAPIVSVSCTAGITNCATAADAFSPANATDWRNTGTTAYWTSTSESITFTLDGNRTLTGITAVVDNNDTYAFQKLDSGAWTTFATILASDGTVINGTERFELTFAPVTTSAVRLMATGGDNAYGVGEISFAVTPVPEPTTSAMALAGLGLMGVVVARRRRVER